MNQQNPVPLFEKLVPQIFLQRWYLFVSATWYQRNLSLGKSEHTSVEHLKKAILCDSGESKAGENY